MTDEVLVIGGAIVLVLVVGVLFSRWDRRRMDAAIARKYPKPADAARDDLAGSGAPSDFGVPESRGRPWQEATSNLTAYDWACLNFMAAETHAQIDATIAGLITVVVMFGGMYAAITQYSHMPSWLTVPAVWVGALVIGHYLRKPSADRLEQARKRVDSFH